MPRDLGHAGKEDLVGRFSGERLEVVAPFVAFLIGSGQVVAPPAGSTLASALSAQPKGDTEVGMRPDFSPSLDVFPADAPLEEVQGFGSAQDTVFDEPPAAAQDTAFDVLEPAPADEPGFPVLPAADTALDMPPFPEPPARREEETRRLTAAEADEDKQTSRVETPTDAKPAPPPRAPDEVVSDTVGFYNRTRALKPEERSSPIELNAEESIEEAQKRDTDRFRARREAIPDLPHPEGEDSEVLSSEVGEEAPHLEAVTEERVAAGRDTRRFYLSRLDESIVDDEMYDDEEGEVTEVPGPPLSLEPESAGETAVDDFAAVGEGEQYADTPGDSAEEVAAEAGAETGEDTGAEIDEGIVVEEAPGMRTEIPLSADALTPDEAEVSAGASEDGAPGMPAEIPPEAEAAVEEDEASSAETVIPAGKPEIASPPMSEAEAAFAEAFGEEEKSSAETVIPGEEPATRRSPTSSLLEEKWADALDDERKRTRAIRRITENFTRRLKKEQEERDRRKPHTGPLPPPEADAEPATEPGDELSEMAQRLERRTESIRREVLQRTKPVEAEDAAEPGKETETSAPEATPPEEEAQDTVLARIEERLGGAAASIDEILDTTGVPKAAPSDDTSLNLAGAGGLFAGKTPAARVPEGDPFAGMDLDELVAAAAGLREEVEALKMLGGEDVFQPTESPAPTSLAGLLSLSADRMPTDALARATNEVLGSALARDLDAMWEDLDERKTARVSRGQVRHIEHRDIGVEFAQGPLWQTLVGIAGASAALMGLFIYLWFLITTGGP